MRTNATMATTGGIGTVIAEVDDRFGRRRVTWETATPTPGTDWRWNSVFF